MIDYRVLIFRFIYRSWEKKIRTKNYLINENNLYVISKNSILLAEKKANKKFRKTTIIAFIYLYITHIA